MQDKRALQSGTSHYFGENFARAFDIKFLDQNNTLQYCHTTSWGFSTRVIGAIIMTHGDDQGLVMPPKLAPIQAVIVPIYKSDAEKSKVMEVADRIFFELKAAGIRTKLDDREGVTPGFKFNDWEFRGIPIRVEIGPRDVEKNSVALARRDVPGRDGKTFVPQTDLAATVSNLLTDIHDSMLKRAIQYRDANIHDPQTYEEFKEAVSGAWAFSWWCGDAACEAKVKEDTRATARCIPLEGQPGGTGTCIVCGKEADKKVLFGKAY
jgi:prolyl-tRNA synthetase